MINKYDVIEIDIIVRDNNTKEILDTTIESFAKDNNVYKNNIDYKSMTLIFGDKEILENIEKNIESLDVGKTKTFSLKKEEAFGDRNSKNKKLFLLSDFKKENITPQLGMVLNFGGRTGKVLSVSGGRVMVDFNPEFAGKDLEYTITVNKINNDNQTKAKHLFDKFFYFLPNVKEISLNLKENILEIDLPKDLPEQISFLKDAYIKKIKEISTISEVKFL